MKIFISYRRADSAPYSGRLRDALAAHFHDASVFFDVSSIDAGATFTNAIVDAMALADVVVVVIGPNWVTASSPDGTGRTTHRLDDALDTVRNEIRAALDREREIVPVLVGGATMPRREQLPDELKPIATRNAFRLSDDQWADDVERLISTIERLVTRDRGAVSPEINQAVDAIQCQNYASAVDLLTRSLNDHPTAEGHYYRGLAEFYQSNFRPAAADFEQAITLATGWAMAHRQRANALFSLGDYNDALASYDRAITLEPREPRAYINRAEAHLKLGNDSAAIVDLKKVIDLHADAGLERLAEAKLQEIRARRPPPSAGTDVPSAQKPAAAAKVTVAKPQSRKDKRR
jgi:tetratricopeptide (TPR) repeat protein